MKTKLLSLLLILSTFAFSQVPSLGLQKSYLFTGSSLQNFQNPGTADLTQVGSAATFVSDRYGTANGALNLNGDYFEAGSFNGGYLTKTNDKTEFTINFWLKTTTNDAQVRLLLSHGDNATRGYKAYLRNGIVTFAGSYYTNVNSGWVAASSGVISDGQWHFVSLVSTRYDYPPNIANGSTIRYYVYIDGAYVASGENSLTSTAYSMYLTSDAAYPQRFGIDYNVAGDRYQDDIDNINIYNRRLTNEEIVDVYLEGQPTNVSGAVANATTLNMDWTAADTETLWDVTYVPTGGDVANGVTMHDVTKPYALKAIAPNTTYDVYVRAVNGIYNGSYSTAFTFTTGAQAVVYVDSNATGNNDGTSWTDALTDLAQGINGASAGTQVWVAQASYNPSVDEYGTLATDIKARYFWTKDGVEVLGGFLGTETLESERDPVNQKATLEGYMNATDRVYSVLKIDADNTAKFDGFIVNGGASTGNGGGMYLTGDASFYNIEFTNNYATAHGAAVYAIGSNSTFVNCRFEANTAGMDGGAFYAHTSTIHIYNSVMFNNAAYRYGVAINSYQSLLYLHNNTVVSNKGGTNTIQLSQNSQISIQQCIFWDNNTTYASSTGSGSIIFNNGIFEGTTPTGGSVNTDPLFVDMANGDLHLTGCSPAINAVVGTPTNPYTDIDGNNRISDGIMDFGAYEVPAPNAISITLAQATLCENEMQTLTAVGLTNVSWNNGISDGVSFIPDPDLTYTVTGDNSNNCSASIDANFTVNSGPAIEITASNAAVCLGSEVTLTASGADTYLWDNSVTNGVGFTPSATGTYTVTGTVSGNSCETSETIEITVSNITDEAVSATDSEVCMGTSTTIMTASSDNNAKYYLRDASNNVIEGPINGDGTSLSFTTGNLSADTEFNILGNIINERTDLYGLDFDGTNDYVQTTYTLPVTNTFTIEAWLFPRQAGYDRVIGNFDGDGAIANGEILIDTYDGGPQTGRGLRFLVGGSGTSVNLTLAGVLTLNAWNHTVFTFNNGVIKTYVNGVEVGSATATFTQFPSNSQPFAFGSDRIIVYPTYLNGKMDDVRFWETARTATEINEFMNVPLYGNEAGLGAYYNFEDTTGTVVTDLVAAQNGTLINMDPSTDWVWGKNLTESELICSKQMTQTATVAVVSPYNLIETVETCIGENYTFPDGTTQNNITAQVVYTSNLQTIVSGCDSIIETTVNVSPSYNLTETVSICSGENYTFPDGTSQSNITAQVVYTSNLQTIASSCDSVIVTTINVNQSYNETENANVCSGDSYTFPDGTTQNNITGQVIHTSNLLTVSTSCDSIINTTVNVNPSYTLTETVSVCSGEGYTFPDGTSQSNITAQAIYTSNLQTMGSGCDSIIETTVNVNPSYSVAETVSICSGEDYTFPDGTTQNNIIAQVVHTSNLQTVGILCDSIIETTVTINPFYNLTETVEICIGESYTFPDGSTQNNITAQVVYTSNMQTISTSCDSTIVTTVNVSPTYNATETAFVCSGEDYTFPDGTIQSGITSQVIYTSNLLTVNTSCDSIIETTVNVNPIYMQSEVLSICSGNSHTFPDGTIQSNITSQVIYTSNLLTASTSCDSVIVTTLNINPSYNISESATICSGENYTFPDGTSQSNITSQVVYTSNLQTVETSCDSIIITTVNIGQSYNLSESFSICSGENYTFPDGTIQSNITSQVVYTSNLQTAETSCDSIIITTVNIGQAYNLSESLSICSGENYTFPDGTIQSNITSQVVYTSNLQTVETSCDSIIITTVNIGQSYNLSESLSICSGENYTFPDGTMQNNITSQIVYTSNLQTINTACDSIIETTVNVNFIDLTLSQNGTTIAISQAGAAYRWLDCNNDYTEIPNETGQSFSATSSGDYAAEITLNNCVDTTICSAVVVTGIIATNSFAFSVFPNPASNRINISSSETIEKVFIYDVNGTLVRSINEDFQMIHISSLAKGMYIVVVKSDKGNSRGLFIKE